VVQLTRDGISQTANQPATLWFTQLTPCQKEGVKEEENSVCRWGLASQKIIDMCDMSSFNV